MLQNESNDNYDILKQTQTETQQQAKHHRKGISFMCKQRDERDAVWSGTVGQRTCFLSTTVGVQ